MVEFCGDLDCCVVGCFGDCSVCGRSSAKTESEMIQIRGNGDVMANDVCGSLSEYPDWSHVALEALVFFYFVN